MKLVCILVRKVKRQETRTADFDVFVLVEARSAQTESTNTVRVLVLALIDGLNADLVQWNQGFYNKVLKRLTREKFICRDYKLEKSWNSTGEPQYFWLQNSQDGLYDVHCCFWKFFSFFGMTPAAMASPQDTSMGFAFFFGGDREYLSITYGICCL